MKDSAKNSVCVWDYVRWPFSRRIRRKIRRCAKGNTERCTLVMTLVVRNEEDIVESHIRFHRAMGVDAFIVSSHNSTDKTNVILKRLQQEGLIWKIYYRTTPEHRHAEWVNEMVHCAHKYGADWVINADGDEFYYSDKLDLKKSILESQNANSLWVDSIFLFPDNEDNFLLSTYFVTRPMQKFEAQMLGVMDNDLYVDYIGSQGCTKVIHKTKGFISVVDGNHDVVMKNKVFCRAAGIRLYHYHIRNYSGYEGKVKRWIASARFMPEGQGTHMKHMVQLYEQGLLKEDYERRFSAQVKACLIAAGVVTNDPSVKNFMVKEGII